MDVSRQMPDAVRGFIDVRLVLQEPDVRHGGTAAGEGIDAGNAHVMVLADAVIDERGLRTAAAVHVRDNIFVHKVAVAVQNDGRRGECVVTEVFHLPAQIGVQLFRGGEQGAPELVFAHLHFFRRGSRM